MKAISILIASALLLASCTEEERQRSALRDSAGSPIEVFVDRATGCQYLAIYQKGLSPRYARDGRQICSVKEP